MTSGKSLASIARLFMLAFFLSAVADVKLGVDLSDK